MALTYALPSSTGSRVGEAARGLLQRRIQGDDPTLKAKFREMDEATGQSVADMRSTAQQTMGQGGQMGQGYARRNLMQTEQAGLEQVAKNKLDQAQVAGAQQNQALAAGLSEGGRSDSERLNYLNQLRQNSLDTGDAVTSGALQGIYLTGAGQGYTSEGQQQLASQAAEQKSLADQARAEEEAARRRMAANSGATPWWKKALAGGAAGASAGSFFGPTGSAIGAGVGALASLFD